jgi:hypothetical protein
MTPPIPAVPRLAPTDPDLPDLATPHRASPCAAAPRHAANIKHAGTASCRQTGLGRTTITARISGRSYIYRPLWLRLTTMCYRQRCIQPSKLTDLQRLSSRTVP